MRFQRGEIRHDGIVEIRFVRSDLNEKRREIFHLQQINGKPKPQNKENSPHPLLTPKDEL